MNVIGSQSGLACGEEEEHGGESQSVEILDLNANILFIVCALKAKGTDRWPEISLNPVLIMTVYCISTNRKCHFTGRAEKADIKMRSWHVVLSGVHHQEFPPPSVSLSDMATLLRCRAKRQIKVGIYYIKYTCCDLMCPAVAYAGNVTAAQ